MGISMLGATALGDMLGNLIGGIGGIIMKALALVMGPLLNFIISAVTFVFSYALYTISSFLLALIDFVEVLFRLLAGLEVEGMEMSYQGKGGDLLVSVLRSEEVTQAFLAVAIVGVFLLIITTVFQMIRVEYTTEGSKNAKGPILEKAFRGLCNLMLIPILSILGILIGNELLQLLDTATRGNENASISGQLWVTAAGDAFYMTEREKEQYKLDNPKGIEDIVTQVTVIATDSLVEATEEAFSNKSTTENKPSLEDRVDEEILKINKEEVSDNFLKHVENFNYYKLSDVTEYYKLTDINFFMLIFGACIVIKTLYHAAFGMVNRLYRCVAYFIVSPIAVGMTPINEGNMGTWRKKFLGLVVSAYGVIVSLNLFFVITNVLMSIEFTVSSSNAIGFTQYLGDTMMEGLIKCIFIIVGALMIEKLSGDFVGYFGGEDALSAGKGLAGETTQMATKAISTAVTGAAIIGTGGAAAVGLAGKLGKGVGGMISAGRKGGGKGVGQFVGGGFKNAWGSVTKGAKKVGSGFMQKTGLAGIGDFVHEQQLITAEKKLAKEDEEYGLLSDVEKQAQKDAHETRRKDLEKNVESINEKVLEDKKFASERADDRLNRMSGLGNWMSTSIMNNPIGKGFKEGKDKWVKYEADGTSKSEQGKKAHENVEARKKKTQEDIYNSVHHSDIKIKNENQISTIMNMAVETLGQEQKEKNTAKTKIENEITNLETLANGLTSDTAQIAEDGKYKGWTKGQLDDLIKSKRNEALALDSMNKISVDELKKVVKDIIPTGDLEKDVQNAMKAWFKQKGDDGDKESLDQIKKLFEKVLSNLNSSK